MADFGRGGEGAEVLEEGKVAGGGGDLGLPAAPGEGGRKAVELVAGKGAVEKGEVEILVRAEEGGGLPDLEVGGGQGKGQGGGSGRAARTEPAAKRTAAKVFHVKEE